ncbi:neutral zinc metallopeptidase [Microbispora amethystogenes]|uniref:neutral zinc metallopeptidase n=1 Tax=Microbispora amethystogenes TaxID=1427754 RepID=UPI0033C90309
MIVALIGMLALVFVLVVVMSAMARVARTEDPVSPVALPTYSLPPLPSREPREDDTAAPSRPSSKPTSQATRRPTTPTLNRTAKSNSLYRAGSPARTNCPAGNASIYNHAQFKALILKTGRCMGDAWAPALTRAGIPWTPPHYMIAARKGRGACGDYPSPGSNVPYYCPSNSTIYASTSAMAREYGPLGSWNGIIISMMAHEYGHHLQNVSGISDSWWQQTINSSSRSGKMALSRRHELQATCFGGMFMRSVAASYPIDGSRRNTLLWAYSHLGDPPGGPRDHGNTRSNAAWFRQGYTRPMAYQCNTWVVGSSSVS